MIVRIGCMYADDWDFNDYEEGERIRIDPNAISANFMILEDEDQDESLDGREGELSKSFDYELHDGQLCPSSMASSCRVKTAISLNVTFAREMGSGRD